MSMVSSLREVRSLDTKKPVVLKVRSASVELGGRVKRALYTFSNSPGLSPEVSRTASSFFTVDKTSFGDKSLKDFLPHDFW